MSEFNLEVQSRKSGKVKEAVSGVVYGGGQEATSIEVEYNALLKIINEAGTSNIIDLKMGTKTWTVILREYQKNPLTEKISHVDFLMIDAKNPLTTVVPLTFTETPKEVREIGGKMEVALSSVKVKCLAQDLPKEILVDVSGLTVIGKSIVVKDLVIQDSVKILNNPGDKIVSVIIPKKVQIATAASAAVEGAAAEGEVKKEGEGSAEGETKKEGEKEEK